MSGRYKIGFTGTQEGMPNKQIDNFVVIFSWFYTRHPYGIEVHQGQCIGADEQITYLVKKMPGVWVVSHPPLDTRRTHTIECDEVREPFPFIERNHNIVDSVSMLLAAPRSRKEELRSGTWATVRYARKMNKPLEMVWPD